MVTAQSVLDELKAKGSVKTRAILARHGNSLDRTLGVNIADLKPIAKTIKGQHDLACELFESGYLEAMYLAGLVTDGAKLTREQLESWVRQAAGLQMISEYTVPWVTVDNPAARELAVEWIGSTEEHIASAGWCTYAGLLALKDDASLDFAEIENLLGTVVRDVAGADNRVRSTMNSFLIAVGTYVKPLLDTAKATAQEIGDVSVDVGETACKVPLATAYIARAEAAGKSGQKKKTIRC